jgi:diaminohydroxyphosphoribosylaminopyrimidine deaminase / 5-amino-6-(5-phosphoribosylamino)uracil reductase
MTNNGPMTNNDQHFMRRCFDLAERGGGQVSPNPMVGAVLVFEDKIIGEGWHQKWGEAHAEVNCFRSVSPENQHLVARSTLFCSLEPCSHFGKTPPCADLILEKRIPRVVVSNVDPNPLVAGRGLEKLRAAGVLVESGVLEAEGQWLNRAFFTWMREKRPHIVLKWAQSADGFIGRVGERTAISGPAIRRLVHRWRAECDAILVGTTTALVDDPRLDARFFGSKNPLRVAIDLEGKIPPTHHFFDGSAETWVFGKPRAELEAACARFFPAESNLLIPNVLSQLRDANRAILLVEGGAHLLHQFLEIGLWDEIRVIENARRLGGGIPAPGTPTTAILHESFRVADDVVRVFSKK